MIYKGVKIPVKKHEGVKCPNCGSHNTDYETYGRLFVDQFDDMKCYDCGYTW